MEKKKKKRITIGFLMDWIDSPYQAHILSGVEEFVALKDINLICFVTGRLLAINDWERNRNILFDFVSSESVDGLLMMTPALSNIVGIEYFTEFVEKYKPLPIVSIAVEIPGYPYVRIDNNKGMREAMEHLVKFHGYKRIAYIRGPEGNPEAIERLNTYYQVLQENKLPINSNLVVKGGFDFESGHRAIRILLDERKEKFDAIITASDDMAIGAIEELKLKGIQVPEDIAMVGFDDVESSQNASLTTVRQPIHSYGKKATEVLYKMIKNQKVNKVYELPTQLVVRESCGCLSSNTRQAVVNVYSVVDESLDSYLLKEKANLILEIRKLLNIHKQVASKEFTKLLEQLLENLKREILEKHENAFLHAWNKIIFWANRYNFPFFVLHNVLSKIREEIIPLMRERKKLIITENLFQQARIKISESMSQKEILERVFFTLQSQKLNDMGEELAESTDTKTMLEVIYSRLPAMGIKKCYFSVYENASPPYDFSRLILAFDTSGRIKLPEEGIRFPTKRLFPESLINKKERCSFVVYALFHNNDHMGFVIFNLIAENTHLYEVLHHWFKTVFGGVRMIEKIRNQALHLEELVNQRTADLSESNNLLQQEIQERRKTEEKLKQALEELEKYNEILHSQSIRDELTNLYNRRGFFTLAEQHFQYARRKKQEFLLFFADLDRLKEINDNYGHQEGDEALVKTAEILKGCFRQMDIIARMGGDEFVILVVDSTLKDKDYLIKRLENLISDYNQKSGKPYSLSISVGTAFYSSDYAKSLDTLLAEADVDLYNQKQIKKHIQ